jgi:hypothetical protein
MSEILNFGKHKGKSLAQVVLHDPDYFFRANDTHAFLRQGFPEASSLAWKACNIKMPKPNAEDRCVQYHFEPGTEIFHGFKLVQRPAPEEYPGLPGFMRQPPNSLDLSVVYRRNRRDKIGNERLLRDFKHYYFENAHGNLSRKECDAFFDDRSNFCRRGCLCRFFTNTKCEDCSSSF